MMLVKKEQSDTVKIQDPVKALLRRLPSFQEPKKMTLDSSASQGFDGLATLIRKSTTYMWFISKKMNITDFKRIMADQFRDQL